MSQEKSSAHADAPVRSPSVDRPIELASNKEGPRPANPKEPQDKSMWKLLLQLRSFLPYLARLVPMLDVAVAPLQNAALSSDIRKAVAQSMTESAASIQSIQRDLNAGVIAALDQQSAQLKRLEDELARFRLAFEKFTGTQAGLVEDLGQIAKLVRFSAIGLGILLLALIVMTAVLLTRLPH